MILVRNPKQAPSRMTRSLLITVLVLLILAVPGYGPRASEVTQLLSDSGDQVLQQRLEALIRQQGLWTAAERGDLAVTLAVVTDPSSPRLAQINGHRMVYAASLPKIAILLGAAVSIEEGRLELSEELEKDLHNMIRYSCNACATRVLEQVGRDEMLTILQSPEFLFYDAESWGGLWIGKDYGPAQAYQRDPLAGLSHGATSFQAARFYYKLYTGTLVSTEASNLMLDTLIRPGIRHKFVKALISYPGLDIYRKSGSWKDWHADSALVVRGDEAYIMVVLAHDPQADQWLENLAVPLHELALTPDLAGQSRRD